MSNNIRINIVIIVIFLVGGIVLSRLFYLQINQGEYYKAMAQGQQTSLSESQGERGEVVFKNGEVLAMTEKEPYLFVSPEEIKNKEVTAQMLAEKTGKDMDALLITMNKAGSFYEVIEENIDKAKTDEISELGLTGVHIGYKTKRYYPSEKTASQIIGFINQEGLGQYGLEGYYNNQIKGETAVSKTEKNPWSFLFKLSEKESLNGAALGLTIDYNIQFMAEKVLNESVQKYDAEGGEIIVMDPNTGAIIAMAQNPNFNPNNYQTASMESFQNSCIQKLFEPGSIFKPITMSMAINEKVVTPETIHDDKLGYVQYGKYKVFNYLEKIWGKITMTEVLQGSVNTGVMFAENLIGHEKFYNYLKIFGLFEDTGIDLNGEISSSNKEIKKALDNHIEVNFANASFGQGIGMTPLQMTRAFATVINGGKLYKPYVVESITTAGKEKKIKPITIKENVISSETSATLRTMLVNVVEKGFGHLAKVSGYYVGGKTGTSQIPYSSLGINQSGYSDHTWQTFMGFAPAYDPKFIILVKLNNPTATKTSEYSAVPTFHDLAKYIIDYWQIPPDYDDTITTKALDK
ncbi:MAG: penicillin-binding protein 2 [Candidatus Paceibacterota bacterium]|jgi:cell division protein FtsI (penicillin-binding protein 3)/stage V sporulation protein D (sporulation-specific penicillin-binding protein)